MPLGLQAIIPKNRVGPDVGNVERYLQRALTSYGLAMTAQLGKYPPQVPPMTMTGGIPKRKRKPYRRTGDYGRGWNGPGSVRVSGYTLTVVNRISYGVYVGGPRVGEGPGFRQARIMNRRGWPSITDVARTTAPRFRPVMNRAILGRP